MNKYYIEYENEEQTEFYRRKEKQKTCKVCLKLGFSKSGCKRHHASGGLFHIKHKQITDKEVLNFLNQKYDRDYNNGKV